jgi:anti-sigma factor RsiW
MTTNHSRWTDQLSAYLDGELPAEKRAALEEHLGSCVACRSVLEDFQAIVAAAPQYAGREPEQDLWPEIRDEIDAGREVPLTPRRRALPRMFTLPQMVAASIAFALVSSSAVYFLLRPEPVPVATVQPPVAAPPGSLAAPSFRSVRAGAAYDQAVSDLERVLAEGRNRLDPRTLKVIEDNLGVIDRALAEARAAIAADPAANSYLSAQVVANMHRKLELLRLAANAIAAAES